MLKSYFSDLSIFFAFFMRTPPAMAEACKSLTSAFCGQGGPYGQNGLKKQNCPYCPSGPFCLEKI